MPELNNFTLPKVLAVTDTLLQSTEAGDFCWFNASIRFPSEFYIHYSMRLTSMLLRSSKQGFLGRN